MQRNNLKLIGMAISIAFSSSAFAVNAQKTTPAPLISQLSTPHQADQNVSIQEMLNKVTAESGISFIVDIDISKDKTTIADSTANSIKRLLAGYNWVGIKDKGTLKKVIITSKNANYDTPVEDSPAKDINNANASNSSELENIEGQVVTAYLQDEEANLTTEN
jgi:fucose permease